MSNFTVVYARESPPSSFHKSIFLAGPTPRHPDVPSWRPAVLEVLHAAGYDGVVFVPEDRPDVDGISRFKGDYEDQLDWETRYKDTADVVLFWVPRNMTAMPALRTNVEWGELMNSGRAVFGAPPESEKNRSLLLDAERHCVPTATTLEKTVAHTLELIGHGAYREGGERDVPLHIWKTPSFQQWYRMLKKSGNRLDSARQVWTFRVGPQQKFMLYWALHVDIYVASEDRHKTNEVVLSRPDISTIVMYRRAEKLDDSPVVLVREFRSPVSNTAGYVYESAGGSSFKPGGDPLQLAADEVCEETGISIDAARFTRHESRQVVATLSTHKPHLFSVEITDEELELLRAKVGVAHGVIEDTERTYVEIFTLGQIRRSSVVDWSMLGMILQVLA